MISPATLPALSAWLPGPAASARVIAELYTLLLILSALLILTGIAAAALRAAPAGTRVLVWRAATLALLTACIGHLLPVELVTGTVPAGLAEPLVRLGRLQVALAESTGAGLAGMITETAPAGNGGLIMQLLVVAYAAGVVAVLSRVAVGRLILRAMARRAKPVRDARWLEVLRETSQTIGVRQPVRCLVMDELRVPVTWGFVRPVIGLPRDAERWSRTRRRAVLLHELAHVGAADASFTALTRMLCAVLWFHPGVWWLARHFRLACELAADDRVLAGGIRASDYAELLMHAADARRGATRIAGAVALSRRVGLSLRLAAIVDVHRDLGAPGRGARIAAVVLALMVAVPAGVARLAPSRDVLTALMRDAHWDARAYAVVGLAQRPDSIDVARAASQFDPNPRVRAWARLALDRAPAGRALPFLLDTLPTLSTLPALPALRSDHRSR